MPLDKTGRNIMLPRFMSYYFMLWGLKTVTLKMKDSKVLFVTFSDNMSSDIQDGMLLLNVQ